MRRSGSLLMFAVLAAILPAAACTWLRAAPNVPATEVAVAALVQSTVEPAVRDTVAVAVRRTLTAAAPTATRAPEPTPTPTTMPHLSQEEILAKARSDVSYAELDMNTTEYVGTIVHYAGGVIAVWEHEANRHTLFLGVTKVEGGWTDVLMIGYDPTANPQAVMGDVIDVWGYVTGRYSYTSVGGDEVNVPGLWAEIVNLPKPAAIGERVEAQTGFLAVTVQEAWITSSLDERATPATEAGRMYIVVDLILENASPTEIVVDPGDLMVTDSRGYEYTGTKGPEPSLSYGYLIAGEKMRCYAAFPVPVGAEGFVLCFSDTGRPCVELGL